MERDFIFKGCTRPPMMLGVPLAPLMVLMGVCFLSGLWGIIISMSLWPAFFSAMFFTVMIVTMRAVVKKDDQRFRQIYLWIILRLFNFSKRHWGVTSYSPYRYKRR